MSTRDWHYALKIRGYTPRTLPMARLAEYLREFAALLGDEANPSFAGMVEGSVVLRATQRADTPKQLVRSRVKAARVDAESPGGRSYAKLNEMLTKDGARGIVFDREGKTVVELPGLVERALPPEREYLVHDVSFIDGTVVGIVGADDTVHLRLQEHSGEVRSVTIRDLSLARELAPQFRGAPVRVHVHGTWRRTVQGMWEPAAVYADRVEALDVATPAEVFRALAEIPGNGWRDVVDPDALLRTIRSGD
jgi:hypothetical protein